MARSTFGGSAADAVWATVRSGSYDLVVSLGGLTVTMWSAETGGTQYTDLLDAGGSPVTSITAAANGQLPQFQGPDGVTSLWADAGGGRVRLNTASALTNDAIMAGVVEDTGSDTRVALDAAYASVGAVGYKPAKRVTFPLASPESTQAAAAFDRGSRMPVRLPVTTTRWRIKVANRDCFNQANLTTALTSSGFYFGTPDFDTSTGNWNGNFTAPPAQVVSAFSVPTDGTDYASPWIADPAQQFTANKDRMLSWNIASAAATGTGQGVSFARQAFQQNSGGASLAGAQNASGGFFAASITGDIRIEYEYAGTQPVGLVVGDSITHGKGDGDVSNSRPATLVHQTWPSLAGEAIGATVVNLAVTSGVCTQFNATNKMAFTRADLATTVPDFALIALGTNEQSSPASTVEAHLIGVIDTMRALGIPKVYLCTILPRSDHSSQAGTLQASAASGGTSISSSVNTGAVSITIGSGRGQETVTVSSVAGTGPYTLTLSAATTKAHNSGDQIIFSYEQTRQAVNDWIRQLPYGINGVVDFDDVIAVSAGSALPDTRFMSSDGIHPLRAGYQRMAQLAAVTLRR